MFPGIFVFLSSMRQEYEFREGGRGQRSVHPGSKSEKELPVTF